MWTNVHRWVLGLSVALLLITGSGMLVAGVVVYVSDYLNGSYNETAYATALSLIPIGGVLILAAIAMFIFTTSCKGTSLQVIAVDSPMERLYHRSDEEED
jgi:hypothetical protein